MKKFNVLICILLIIFTLTACGDTEKTTEALTATAPTTVTTTLPISSTILESSSITTTQASTTVVTTSVTTTESTTAYYTTEATTTKPTTTKQQTIAEATTTILQDVVQKSADTGSVVQKISDATDKQSAAIEQVVIGMDQINTVVQTNSATAEESAAASEELSGQAGMLKSLVGNFTLRD